MEKIYIDHAATSPLHPSVIKVVTEAMQTTFGNPSSIHSFGRESRHLLDESRQTMASSIGAKPDEIIFTSGGTEADNLAIIGTALHNKDKGMHIITTEIEHHAVLHACEYLEKQGFRVTYLPVDNKGRVSIEDIKAALTDETILVSIMMGNNEVGTMEPVEAIGALLKNHQAFFHTDAVQAYGVVPFRVDELGVDLLSVSSHKINGPKGLGFLYVRNSVSFTPLLYGGEQERKRRAGTENVPSIVGFAEAVKIAMDTLERRTEQYNEWKRLFIDTLVKEEVQFEVNGNPQFSLPHILNVSFEGVNIESLLVNLDLAGISASSGSACTAGSIEPSHVLVSLFGKGSERVTSSVRFSFGLGNTTEQIARAAYETAAIVKRLKI
ncbi:cysteine desulfurase [Priestia filamentosa]|uniref:cysteine desulfurase family protein n=1 Tax=Priestia filamentosa TaxID=1402861 RepID=UPI001FB2544A|nr:cysteine desulfurase family protein [Priestia filamentosa]UOE61318.1 cysteine desulfurase [Priestia filamentosa]